MLEQALRIALDVHSGQVDKQGQPYILHVLRVVAHCPYGDAQVVAALHDCLEDADDLGMVLNWLRGEFPSYIVRAVSTLTRQDDEPYAEYIGRVAENGLATAVKYHDLRDNLHRIEGLRRIDAETAERLEKRYRTALDEIIYAAHHRHLGFESERPRSVAERPA